MTDHDVLFGFRLQLVDLARRTSVSHACRVFNVHRSTYYAWTAKIEQAGLEALRPRQRRLPRMPNQIPPVIEQRILAYSLAFPGYGPDRISAELRRDKWGGIMVSPNGVWRVLCRHGLNTRKKRLGLLAGYAAPYQPPRSPQPESHIDVDHPGQLVGFDCFYLGSLKNAKQPAWQITAIDCYSSYAWAHLVTCPTGKPTSSHTSMLAHHVAETLSHHGWRLERALTDNGTEFKGDFTTTITQLGATHTHTRPGRPQTNGHVENLQRTILDECWRPSFARYLYPHLTALRTDLTTYLHTYNTDRAHKGRLTKGRIPIDIINPAHKLRP